jgi:hypothetical protein
MVAFGFHGPPGPGHQGLLGAVNALRLFQDHPELSIAALNLVGGLAAPLALDELVQVLAETEALVPGLGVLQQHADNASVVVAVLSFFKDLTGPGRSDIAVMLLGVLAHEHVLVSMQQHLVDVQVQRTATELLINLAAGSSQQKVTLAEAGAHLSILAAMQLHAGDPDVAFHGCVALFNLANHEPNRALLLGAGALVRIVSAAPRNIGDIRVLERALIAIQCLCSFPLFVVEPRLVVSGASRLCLDALERHADHDGLVVECLVVLQAIALSPAAGLIGAGAYERVVAAQQRHPASHQVQRLACIALAHIIVFDERCGEDLLGLWAHHGVLDALLHTHALNARVVKMAFLVLRNLARSRHNAAALEEAAVHERILDSMRVHEASSGVLEEGLAALGNLASFGYTRVTLARAATAQILLAMRQHPDDGNLLRNACHALSELALDDESRAVLARLGAHEALVGVVDREAGGNHEGWTLGASQAAQDVGILALLPGARRALVRLAANGDEKLEDEWPIVLDRLRVFRIELSLPVWTESAAARAAAVLAGSPRCAHGFPDLLAHIVLLALGTELVPLDGWKTAGGAGREMALRRLLPRAEMQLRALVIGLLDDEEDGEGTAGATTEL